MVESVILFSILIAYSIFTQDLMSAILAILVWILLHKNSHLQKRVNKLGQDIETLKKQFLKPAETKQLETATKPQEDAAKDSEPDDVSQPVTKPIQASHEKTGEATIQVIQEAKEPSLQKSSSDEKSCLKKPFNNIKNSVSSLEPSVTDNKAKLPIWLIWFNETNITTKIGLLTLFLGFSFLLKFSAEQGFFPIELRLAGVALLAMGFVIYGLKLFQKNDKQQYALLLEGGGVGTLYLTTYFAFKFYDVIPVELGFVLLLTIMALTIYLAVKQNAYPLAFIGILGGFIAPILASTGQGSHIILFGYYLVLNLTILGIAWFKSWRNLNLLGFVLTFGIALLWGASSYKDEFYLSVQLYLIAFFAIYIAIPILFAIKQKPDLKGYVDASLIFGTPVISFVIQAVLMKPFENGLSYSSLIIGVNYFVLALIIYKYFDSHLKLLTQTFGALGTIFITLAIPLYFDNAIAANLWAVEAAGLIWLGWRQSRKFPLIFGSLVLLASIALFFIGNAQYSANNQFLLNSYYFGGLIVTLSTIVSSYFIKQASSAFFKNLYPVSVLLLLLGFIISLVVHWIEFAQQLTYPQIHIAQVLHILILALIMAALEIKLNWKELSYLRFIWLGVLAVSALSSFAEQSHPFAGVGWLVWFITAAAFYALLRFYEQHKSEYLIGLKELHGIALVVFLSIVVFESQRFAMLHFNAAIVESFVLFILPVLFTLYLILKQPCWPIKQHKELYQQQLSKLLIVPIVLWLGTYNIAFTGDALFDLYLPILNMLDITAIASFLLIYQWLKIISFKDKARYKYAQISLAIGLFVFANAVMLRALYHWYGVDYSMHGWLNSSLTQTTIAIFWSLLGILIMQQAHKKQSREIWIAGSILLGLVVIKVFLIDLSNSGSIERIVSFIGVGGVLLLVGYLFPLPENNKKDAAQTDSDKIST